MLLVCRFDVPAADVPGWRAAARRALELLTAQPGCRGGELARAVDEPGSWVLVARFDSVDAYRRASTSCRCSRRPAPTPRPRSRPC